MTRRGRPRRRRRSEAGTVVRFAQPLWVSGECGDPAVGRFAGLAAALHVSSCARGAGALPVIRYCVIDEARQAPVWVEHTDVHETRWLPGREMPRGPDVLLPDERQAADAPADAEGAVST
jgi:hypothetical protein